uniref:Uncharacterized protein n=1 Tax=Talaromyces marneffei PM1 TaxID=1077442 RepID=A0A093UWC4_TALMA
MWETVSLSSPQALHSGESRPYATLQVMTDCQAHNVFHGTLSKTTALLWDC